MRYFSSVTGHAVPRFGARGAFIGCVKRVGGFEWYPDRIVGIPVAELHRAGRAYTRALRSGGLIERTAAEYAAQEKHDEAEAKKAAKQLDTDQRKIREKAEKIRKEQAAAAKAPVAAATPAPTAPEGDGGNADDDEEVG